MDQRKLDQIDLAQLAVVRDRLKYAVCLRRFGLVLPMIMVLGIKLDGRMLMTLGLEKMMNPVRLGKC